jgi:protein SCO1/2
VTATETTNTSVARRRRLIATAALCVFLGGLGGLWAAGTGSSGKPVVRFTPPPGQARDFRLRDQDGKWTTLRDARGSVVVMTWIYSTCRDLCPAEGNIVSDAVKRVGHGVQAYIMSVDPIGDTPERTKGWLQRRQFPPGTARYLIGTRAQLAPVWREYAIAPINASPQEAQAAAVRADEFRKVYAAMVAKNGGKPPPPQPYTHPERGPAPAASDPYPDSRDLEYRGPPRHIAGLDFEHSAYVMLIDKHGNQRVGMPFEQLDAKALADDIRILRSEP